MRFLFFLMCFAVLPVHAADFSDKTRFPAASGLYYPIDADAMKKQTRDLLAAAQGRFRFDGTKIPKAVIVPHNPLNTESGRVAAAGYAALMPLKPFVRRVVIVAEPQHGRYFGISLSSAKYWAMPSGQKFETDRGLTEQLRKIQGFDFDDGAFETEEAIEAQLPFISAVFRPERFKSFLLPMPARPRAFPLCLRVARLLRRSSLPYGDRPVRGIVPPSA